MKPEGLTIILREKTQRRKGEDDFINPNHEEGLFYTNY